MASPTQLEPRKLPDGAGTFPLVGRSHCRRFTCPTFVCAGHVCKMADVPLLLVATDPLGDSLQSSGQAPPVTAGASNVNNNVPAVRFSSAVEEIDPNQPSVISTKADGASADQVIPPEQLRQLKKSVQGCPLQERRINTFQFEPVSLPPSRVRSASLSPATSLP